MIDLVSIRRDLHRIPELGFQEYKTQEYLLRHLSRYPKDRIEWKTWRTGILVRIPGTAGNRTIGYRADMDGLPIREETGLPFASVHEGRMHACGHDIHMTVALGLIDHFVRHPIPDHLLFVFQPAEEGPGGAEPMLKSEPFRKWRPDCIFALHIAPEYPVGTVAVKKGLLFANTSEVFIDLIGKGGHAAYPHLANDTVVAAAHLVGQIQTIVSRNTDPLESAVVTIGKLTAGTAQNVIAESARLEGTIRTLSPETMERTKDRIRQLVRGIGESFRCEAKIDFGAAYYQVVNDERWTEAFIRVVQELPFVRLEECRAAMTGEDFGFMLKEIPGFMFWLGAESAFGLHHSRLDPKEACIEVAVKTMTAFIEKIGRE